MPALHQRGADRFWGVRHVEHVDLTTRRHHRAYGSVAKTHDASDHLFLARLEDTCRFSLRDYRPDFFFSDLFFRLLPVTEEPQHRFARSVQESYKRRTDFGEHGHCRRDLDRHRFRIAERDLLGNQFADD